MSIAHEINRSSLLTVLSAFEPGKAAANIYKCGYRNFPIDIGYTGIKIKLEIYRVVQAALKLLSDLCRENYPRNRDN